MPINLSYSSSKLEYPGSSNEVAYRAKAQENEATFNAAQQRNQLLLQGMNQLEQRKVANETQSDALLEAITKSDLLPEYDKTAKLSLQEYKKRIDDVLNTDIYNSGEAIRKIARDMKTNEGLNTAIANSANFRQFDAMVAANPKYDQITKDYYFGITRPNLINGKGINSRVEIADLYKTPLPEKVDVFKYVTELMQKQLPNASESYIRALFDTDTEDLLKNLNIPKELQVVGQKTLSYIGAKERILNFITDPNTEPGTYLNQIVKFKNELNPNNLVSVRDFASSYVNGLDYESTQTSMPDYWSMSISRSKPSSGGSNTYIDALQAPVEFTRRVGSSVTPQQYQSNKYEHTQSIKEELDKLNSSVSTETKQKIGKFIETEDVAGLNGIIKEIENSNIPSTNYLHAKLSSFVNEVQNRNNKLKDVYGDDFIIAMNESAIVDGKGKAVMVNGIPYSNRMLVNNLETIATKKGIQPSNLISDFNDLISKINLQKRNPLENRTSLNELINKFNLSSIIGSDKELTSFIETFYNTDNNYLEDRNGRSYDSDNDNRSVQAPRRLYPNSNNQGEDVIKFTPSPSVSFMSKYNKNYDKYTKLLETPITERDQTIGVNYKDKDRQDKAVKYIMNVLDNNRLSNEKGTPVNESSLVYKSTASSSDYAATDDFNSIKSEADLDYQGIVPMNGDMYYQFKTNKRTNGIVSHSPESLFVKIPPSEFDFAQIKDDGTDMSKDVKHRMFIRSMDELASKAVNEVDLSQISLFNFLQDGTVFYKRVLPDNNVIYYLTNPNNNINDIAPFNSLYDLTNKLYDIYLTHQSQQ